MVSLFGDHAAVMVSISCSLLCVYPVQTALEGSAEVAQRLESCSNQSDAHFLRTKADAWKLLAESQAALAYTCVVAYSVTSAKLDFMFEGFGSLVQGLQTKCEEVWLSAETCPTLEAKSTIRTLRMRLSDYSLAVQTEIVSDSPGLSLSFSLNVHTAAVAGGASTVPGAGRVWAGAGSAPPFLFGGARPAVSSAAVPALSPFTAPSSSFNLGSGGGAALVTAASVRTAGSSGTPSFGAVASAAELASDNSEVALRGFGNTSTIVIA